MKLDRTILIAILLWSVCSASTSCNAPTSIRPNKVKGFIETEDRDSESQIETPDSSNRWKVQELKTHRLANLNAISLIDEKNGFAYSDKTLFATTDGGQSWFELRPDLPEKSYISRADFFDKSRALLVLQKDEDEYGVNPIKHFWIYVTEDSGGSWKTVYDESDIIVSGIDFFPNGRGFVYGTQYAKGSGIPGNLFLARSSDFGRTWQDISDSVRSIVATDKTKVTYMNDTIVKVDLDAQSNTRVITQSRRLLESCDDGSSWIKLGQYSHDDAQVGIINFGLMDDGREWMFESTYSEEGIRARLKTVRNGKEFTRRVVDGVYLGSVFYVDGESFIAAGQTGNLRRGQDRAIVLATDDGAKSWYEIYRSPTAESIESLQRIDAHSYIGLSSDGTILLIERK